jgi:predicted DNA-binding ribbon-helix-helix protein
MHRTQILLEKWQYERMKTIAEREGRSLSSVVREAIDVFLRRGSAKPATRLSEIVGIAEDTESRGRNHDDVLYRPRNS